MTSPAESMLAMVRPAKSNTLLEVRLRPPEKVDWKVCLPAAVDTVVEFVFKAEDPRDYRVCFARITDQLGFKITRTVADGIAEIAHLVRENVVDNFADQMYRN